MTGWQGDKVIEWQAEPMDAADSVVTLSPLTALKLTFLGSNPNVRIEPLDPLTTTVSYFLGNDPARWRPDVPVYGGVRYVDLYPGVNLVLGKADHFWQLEAEPGAVSSEIQLQVAGAPVEAILDGKLHLDISGETLPIDLPQSSFSYQVIYASDRGNASMFDVRPSTVEENLPAYPSDYAPELIYGTYLGGSGNGPDQAYAIAVDAAGRATVAGGTNSSDFPSTPGVFDPTYNGSDAYVAQLSADGSDLVFATFLGSPSGGFEAARAIALDGAGNVYVTGVVNGPGFPTTPGAFDRSCNDTYCREAFVTRFNANGSALIFSTYLGGNDLDGAYAIAVDSIEPSHCGRLYRVQ